MAYEVKNFSVLSSDGLNTLKGKLYIPTQQIKGLFHLVHGMTEHIGRYNSFFEILAKNGYLCLAYDHLGHGHTATNHDELGFIASKNGDDYLCRDVTVFSNEVRKLYPDIPYILMGHSMGSFIVRIVAQKYIKNIDKLIICGTAGSNPAAPLGLMLTKTISAIKGEKHRSKFLQNMAFGAYNKHFESNSPYEWLTKEQAIKEKYAKDKFCNFKFTVSSMGDLMRLIIKCNSNKWYTQLDTELPILLIAGSDDPVGNYGKGVKSVFDKLILTGHNAKLKLYPDCRHEILNDSCEEEVIADILAFLDK